MDKFYYDVCNDYSLDLCRGVPDDISNYLWKKPIQPVNIFGDYLIGFHKQNKEIHYIVSDIGTLQDEVLF